MARGHVELDGSIGEDGEWIRRMLREAGVDVQRLRTIRGQVSSFPIHQCEPELMLTQVTGRAIIQSDADGENSIGKLIDKTSLTFQSYMLEPILISRRPMTNLTFQTILTFSSKMRFPSLPLSLTFLQRNATE